MTAVDAVGKGRAPAKKIKPKKSKKPGVWHQHREAAAARRLARMLELQRQNHYRLRWIEKYKSLCGTCRLCRQTKPVWGNDEKDLWHLRMWGMPDEFWEMSEICGDCWGNICTYFARRGRGRTIRDPRDINRRIDDIDLISCLAHWVQRRPKWFQDKPTPPLKD